MNIKPSRAHEGQQSKSTPASRAQPGNKNVGIDDNLWYGHIGMINRTNLESNLPLWHQGSNILAYQLQAARQGHPKQLMLLWGAGTGRGKRLKARSCMGVLGSLHYPLIRNAPGFQTYAPTIANSMETRLRAKPAKALERASKRSLWFSGVSFPSS